MYWVLIPSEEIPENLVGIEEQIWRTHRQEVVLHTNRFFASMARISLPAA